MKQIVILLLFIVCLTVGVKAQVITSQMTAAFDAAVQEVVSDNDFQQTYSNLMLFPVPIVCLLLSNNHFSYNYSNHIVFYL